MSNYEAMALALFPGDASQAVTARAMYITIMSDPLYFTKQAAIEAAGIMDAQPVHAEGRMAWDGKVMHRSQPIA